MHNCRALAGALNIHEHRAAWMLLVLWDWALELPPIDGHLGVLVGEPKITVPLLAGALGWTGDQTLLSACLVALGYIDVTADNLRVRGMDRYEEVLQNSIAASEAGKKGASARWRNRINNMATPMKGAMGTPMGVLNQPQSGSHQKIAEGEGEGEIKKEVAPAAPDASETQVLDSAEVLREQEAKGNSRQLSDLLVSIFKEVRGSQYAFQAAKDGDALKRLMKFGSHEEISRRWRMALTHEKDFHRCHTIAAFSAKWNEYSAPQSPSASRPMRDYRGIRK